MASTHGNLQFPVRPNGQNRPLDSVQRSVLTATCNVLGTSFESGAQVYNFLSTTGLPGARGVLGISSTPAVSFVVHIRLPLTARPWFLFDPLLPSKSSACRQGAPITSWRRSVSESL